MAATHNKDVPQPTDFDDKWTAPEVKVWLTKEYPTLVPKFENVTGRNMAKYSKEDLIRVSGEALGLALYNDIHPNGAKGSLEQHNDLLQKQIEEQAKQIEEQAKQIEELKEERSFDAISKISSTKFEAKIKAANIKKNFKFEGNIWDAEHRCNIDQEYTWLLGSESSQYEECMKFIQKAILPDKIKSIRLTKETQTHKDEGLRISGTLGDLSSMISQNNIFIFELKKTVLQTRNLLQACLAIVLVSCVIAQGSVYALFTDLKHIYAGLWLHEGLLDVWPLADLEKVHHFLEEGFAVGGNLDHSSQEEIAGRDMGGEGGSKDGGGSKDEGGREDKGDRKDEGGRGDQGDKRGTKGGEHSGGVTNNKQQKTQQNTCPLFKIDFDLDFVVEQTTSLPVADQLDYFLQVCEPYLADI
eukprot:Phypoly_transcript_04974.p1 GENE.Phypoly_transcript_04974~~Phypoly_transcript_04974.p1  ORF type:complete len:413 (-),score=71.05 Phypoly_transcript_04974:84-1322(-)